MDGVDPSSPVSGDKELNSKWNSFAASSRVSLTSPVVPRRKIQNFGSSRETAEVVEEEDGEPSNDGQSEIRHRSLSPSKSNNQSSSKDEQLIRDYNSSGTTATAPTTDNNNSSSFSSFVPPSPLAPPKKPQRNRSGDGLEKGRRNSLPERPPPKNRTVNSMPDMSRAGRRKNGDQIDYYCGLNDEASRHNASWNDETEPTKKAGRKIRRRAPRQGILGAFSDSELSEASTIASQEMPIATKKQSMMDRRAARKLLREEGIEEMSPDEDDDVIDTDKDLAGLTGLAKSKNKPAAVQPESPNGRSSSLDRRARRRSSNSLGRSGHSQDAGERRRRRKSGDDSTYSKNDTMERRYSNGSSTKVRSNRRRRKSSSGTSSSSSEEEERTPNRRSNSAGRPSRSNSKGRHRRTNSDGAGRRRSRNASATRKSRSRSEEEDEAVNLPENFIIKATPMDLISPCTVASVTSTRKIVQDAISEGSARARLSAPGLVSPGLVSPGFASPGISRRSVETFSSKVSGMTMSTGCSSVSTTSFNDDFSNCVSEESSSKDSIFTELKSIKSNRRLPKGLLKSLQAPSMNSVIDRPNKSDDSYSSSMFMPSKPERQHSREFDPKKKASDLRVSVLDSEDEESSEDEDDPPQLKVAPSTPKSSRRSTLRGLSPGSKAMSKDQLDRFSDFLVKQRSSTSLTDPMRSPPVEGKRPTHLFQKAMSDRLLMTPSIGTEKERLRVEEFLRKRNSSGGGDNEGPLEEDLSRLRSRLDGIKKIPSESKLANKKS